MNEIDLTKEVPVAVKVKSKSKTVKKVKKPAPVVDPRKVALEGIEGAIEALDTENPLPEIKSILLTLNSLRAEFKWGKSE